MFRMQGSFIDNLPKIYGFYTGGFVVFVGFMAIAEWLGATQDLIGIMFVGFTIAIYALIGWLSRTMQIDAYYVAGRRAPRSSPWPAASTWAAIPTSPSWWGGRAATCWSRC
jgi:cation/acetate symporter